MRRKTDERRLAILGAAHQAFAEAGFRGTTIEDIARRFGGSKATIYSYFRSKEDLFVAVTEAFISGAILEAFSLLDPSEEDIAGNLAVFGRAYLRAVLRSDVLALRSMVAIEGQASSLAATFHASGPARAESDLERFFDAHRQAGRIDVDRLGARRLLALIEAEFLEARLFGVIDLPNDAQIAASVALSIEAFLRIYPLRSATG
jgi:AcrR family transcriptional regulator